MFQISFQMSDLTVLGQWEQRGMKERMKGKGWHQILWKRQNEMGKGCWVGSCSAEGSVWRKRGVPVGAEEGWAKVMEVEQHSLLQGLHPHFLIMQLLLHLGQLLLQSGELWTQGRAASYRSHNGLLSPLPAKSASSWRCRNAWLWLHTRTKSIFMASQTEHKICATS